MLPTLRWCQMFYPLIRMTHDNVMRKANTIGTSFCKVIHYRLQFMKVVLPPHLSPHLAKSSLMYNANMGFKFKSKLFHFRWKLVMDKYDSLHSSCYRTVLVATTRICKPQKGSTYLLPFKLCLYIYAALILALFGQFLIMINVLPSN